MVERTFIQNSRLGNRLVVLDSCVLRISGRFRGKSFTSCFELGDLSPRYEHVRHRYRTLILFPVALIVIVVLLSVAAIRQASLSVELVVILGVLIIAPLFWQAFKGFRPVTVFRFKHRNSEAAFDLVSEVGQLEECVHFVEKLSEAIRNSQNGSDSMKSG